MSTHSHSTMPCLIIASPFPFLVLFHFLTFPCTGSPCPGPAPLFTVQGGLALKFMLSLGDLNRLISETGPHYVRCLKPNTFNRSDDFNSQLIAGRVGRVLMLLPLPPKASMPSKSHPPNKKEEEEKKQERREKHQNKRREEKDEREEERMGFAGK